MLQLVELAASTAIVLATFPWNGEVVARLLALPGLAVSLMTWAVLWNLNTFIARSDGPSRPIWTYATPAEIAQFGALAAAGYALGTTVSLQILHVHAHPKRLADLSVSVAALSHRTGMLCAIGGSITLALFIAVYGIHNLIDRPIYLPNYAIPQFASVSAFLQPTAWVLLSTAFIAGRRNADRVLVSGASALLALEVIVVYASASRLLAVLPVLSLLISILFGGRLSVPAMIAVPLLVFIGSGLALLDRSSAIGHGLVPYLLNWRDVGSIFNADGLLDSLGNVLFALPLSAFVGRFGSFTFMDLSISASPSLGSNAEWYSIAGSLRVHDFIPYNALGEMYALSPWALIVFTMAVPTVFAILVRIAGNSVASAVIASLYVLTFILTLQYNSRSSFRVVYAAMVVSLVSWLLAKVDLPESAPHSRSGAARHNNS